MNEAIQHALRTRILREPGPLASQKKRAPPHRNWYKNPSALSPSVDHILRHSRAGGRSHSVHYSVSFLFMLIKLFSTFHGCAHTFAYMRVRCWLRDWGGLQLEQCASVDLVAGGTIESVVVALCARSRALRQTHAATRGGILCGGQCRRWNAYAASRNVRRYTSVGTHTHSSCTCRRVRWSISPAVRVLYILGRVMLSVNFFVNICMRVCMCVLVHGGE